MADTPLLFSTFDVVGASFDPITDSEITVLLSRAVSEYMTKEAPVGWFSANVWAVKYDYQFTLIDFPNSNYLGVGNIKGSLDAFQPNGNEAMTTSAYTNPSAQSRAVIEIYHPTAATQSTITAAVAQGTRHYVTISFDPGVGANGTFYTIYRTGSHTGTVVWSTSIALNEAHTAEKFLYASQSWNIGQAKDWEGDVSNMSIDPDPFVSGVVNNPLISPVFGQRGFIAA